MKVLFDQGIPYSTVKHLESVNWDVVLHLTDAGMQRAMVSPIFPSVALESVSFANQRKLRMHVIELEARCIQVATVNPFLPQQP